MKPISDLKLLNQVVLVVALSAPLVANSESSPFQEMIQQSSGWIQELKSEARIVLSLTIGIGIVGLVISGFQALSRNWVKGTTIALGLVVGTLTLVKNEAFNADHKDLWRRAARGEMLIVEMRRAESQFLQTQNEKNRTEFDKEIRTHYKTVHELRTGMVDERKGEKQTSIFRMAYADFTFDEQRLTLDERRVSLRGPDWTRQVPGDSSGLYFVGVADGRLVSDAKRASLMNALEDGGDFLMAQFLPIRDTSKEIATRLSEYIVDAAEVRGTHSEYDKATDTYRFFTLLRIEREIAQGFLRVFAKRNNLSEAPLAGAVSQAKTPVSHYAGRLTTYRGALDDTKQKLSPDQYNLFSQARFQRQIGRCDKATPLLKDLVDKKPEAYFVWYNLALCLENSRTSTGTVEARQAYNAAVKLESRLPFRDASVYNSYGLFLYGNTDYKAAIQSLRKALEIDPSNPKAIVTLRAAEAQLRPTR